MELENKISLLTENQLISTLVLVVAIILVRLISSRYLKKHVAGDAEQRRRITSNIKNALFIVLAVGLLFIWAPSLRTFALSLTAFAVAIILATKELILCFSGTFLKTSTGDIKVGDWITVNGVRGEVIEQNMMSTKLQELGEGGSRFDFTGRTITLPNSIFLSAHIINDEMNKKYVYHTTTIAIDKSGDPAPIIKAMTNSINEAVKGDKEAAGKYRASIEKRIGITLPDPEPSVHFSTTGEGKVKMNIRAMLPTKLATKIERTAMLAGLEAIRLQSEAEAPTDQDVDKASS